MDRQNRIFDAATLFGTIPRELAMKHSGMELFQMMLAGDLPQPPIAGTFNFRLAEAEEGRAVFRGIPLADFYNPISQFLVKITNPVVVPLRRVIPGYGGIDMASHGLSFPVTPMLSRRLISPRK